MEDPARTFRPERISIGDAPWVPRLATDWLVLFGIVVVAFLVRSVPLLRGAGLNGILGYDEGVYFASAAAFIGGRLPYRDFLLLHPPGIVVILSPFALLARVTDDATGFALARVAFMVLGAVNAGLVTLVAGRYGRRAAFFSGALYAIWLSAIRVERTTLLLDPETTLLLVGVLILGMGAPIRPRRAIVAGVVLGLSISIQLWEVVPLGVIVTFAAIESRDLPGGWRRPVIGILAGATLGFAVVCLPFVLAAPGESFRYMVLDQMARPDRGVTIGTRLRQLEGLPGVGVRFRLAFDLAVVGLAAIGAAAAVAVAWRVRTARMWCVLVMIETAYLLAGPVFYSHYSGWVAPPAAIVLGITAAAVTGSVDRYRRLGTVVRAGSVLVVCAIALATVSRHDGKSLQRLAVERDLVGARCVTADTPVLLVETTGLRRDLTSGCPLIVDPTGVSYDTDRGRLIPGPVGASRQAASGYQRAMAAYYSGSDAVLLGQPGADGLTAATMSAIERSLPVALVRGTIMEFLRPGNTPR